MREAARPPGNLAPGGDVDPSVLPPTGAGRERDRGRARGASAVLRRAGSKGLGYASTGSGRAPPGIWLASLRLAELLPTPVFGPFVPLPLPPPEFRARTTARATIFAVSLATGVPDVR